MREVFKGAGKQQVWAGDEEVSGRVGSGTPPEARIVSLIFTTPGTGSHQ